MRPLHLAAFPRYLVVAQGVLALVAGPLGIAGLVDGELLQGALLLGLGIVNALSAVVQSGQRLTVSDDGFEVPADLRPRRVPWAEVERVHLDWSALAGRRDREVVRIDRRGDEPVRGYVPTRIGSTLTSHRRELDAALRERAEAHGFQLTITDGGNGPGASG